MNRCNGSRFFLASSIDDHFIKVEDIADLFLDLGEM
jgi:hypothetical protein